MKIINSSYEILKEDNILKRIELAGRKCYKSEDRIQEGTAEKFIKDIIIPRKHESVLEHGTLYFKTNVVITPVSRYLKTYSPSVLYKENDYHYQAINVRAFRDLIKKYVTTTKNPSRTGEKYVAPALTAAIKLYPWIIEGIDLNSEFTNVFTSNTIISITENELPDGAKYLIRPSVLFICDRGITHELVRHRLCSFSQESTRYCNYSKGKYSNELTVIRPCFDTWDDVLMSVWEESCKQAEKNYNHLSQLSATAQEARSVLPNSLKSEIVMTTDLEDWDHIFSLRCSSDAHPQMRELMIPLNKEMHDLYPNYIKLYS